MSKVGLAKEMFGKKESDLNPQELKEYQREKQKRYYAKHPEAQDKQRRQVRDWKATHKEQVRAYDKAYRKAGKVLDNDKVLTLALALACERLSREDVSPEQATPKYYRNLARGIMREERKEAQERFKDWSRE